MIERVAQGDCEYCEESARVVGMKLFVCGGCRVGGKCCYWSRQNQNTSFPDAWKSGAHQSASILQNLELHTTSLSFKLCTLAFLKPSSYITSSVCSQEVDAPLRTSPGVSLNLTAEPMVFIIAETVCSISLSWTIPQATVWE